MAGPPHGDNRTATLVQTSLRAAMTYAQATAAVDTGARTPQARTASTPRTEAQMLLQHWQRTEPPDGTRAHAREHRATHPRPRRGRALHPRERARSTSEQERGTQQTPTRLLLLQQQQQATNTRASARAGEREAARALAKRERATRADTARARPR